MSEEYSPEISQDLRERANYIRYAFFEDIDQNLLRIENKFIENGLNVLWAPDESSLCSHIFNLLPKKSHNKVCFDVDRIPDELSADPSLVKVCTPLSVANRETEAETLVVNADFAVAEDGSLLFADRPSKNCFNLVNNVIVIVNIDQILVNCSDISLIMKLKSKSQSYFPADVKVLAKSFTKIVADNFATSESVGFREDPVNVSVILYENGISDILQDISLRESLYCIHCGRCMEVCPVAKSSTSISPIQIIKNNCLDQYNKTLSIFSQTTLCGMCQEVCPVMIPLTELLVYEMGFVNNNSSKFKDKKIFSIFSKRSMLNKMNSSFFRFFWTKALYGKNKNLYTYFKNNKSTFYNLENEVIIDKDSDSSLDTNGIF